MKLSDECIFESMVIQLVVISQEIIIKRFVSINPEVVHDAKSSIAEWNIKLFAKFSTIFVFKIELSK